MVQVGKVKAFSEVGVRHTVRLTDDIESRNDLASRLEKVCEIDRVGRDWMKSGKFEPTEPAPVKKRKK